MEQLGVDAVKDLGGELSEVLAEIDRLLEPERRLAIDAADEVCRTLGVAQPRQIFYTNSGTGQPSGRMLRSIRRKAKRANLKLVKI
jgi:hypothetical protein